MTVKDFPTFNLKGKVIEEVTDKFIVIQYQGRQQRIPLDEGGNFVYNIDVTNLTTCNKMFGGLPLESLNMTFDTSKVRNMGVMFSHLLSIEYLNVSKFNTSNVNSMKDMFSDCSRLKSLDLRSFDTSNVADMSYMFANCSDLTKIQFGTFDMSSVSDPLMSTGTMFRYCNSLTTVTGNITGIWGSIVLKECPFLTNDSIMTFIKGCLDRGTIMTLHQMVYDRLTNEHYAEASKRNVNFVVE